MAKLKALVTGGVSGIGLATAAHLLQRGCEVIVTTHQEIRALPSNISTARLVVCDLTDLRDRENLKGDVVDIDILINNAGRMNGFGLDRYTDELRNIMFQLNLWAPVELIAHYAPSMTTRGHARVVNNTSIAAHIGHPDVWYGATKSGLLNATKSLAKSMGPSGLVVNAVAAGPTETPMLHTIPEERKKTMKAASILNRFATAAEVAQCICWLALDAPPYINGVCIDINNGSFLR